MTNHYSITDGVTIRNERSVSTSNRSGSLPFRDVEILRGRDGRDGRDGLVGELLVLLGPLVHLELESQGHLAPRESEALLDHKWEEWYTPGGGEPPAPAQREQSSSTMG